MVLYLPSNFIDWKFEMKIKFYKSFWDENFEILLIFKLAQENSRNSLLSNFKNILFIYSRFRPFDLFERSEVQFTYHEFSFQSLWRMSFSSRRNSIQKSLEKEKGLQIIREKSDRKLPINWLIQKWVFSRISTLESKFHFCRD